MHWSFPSCSGGKGQLQGSDNSGLFTISSRSSDPPSIWSSFLLRVDSMLLSRAIGEEQARALRQLALRGDHQAGERFIKSREGDDRSLAGALLPLLDGRNRWQKVELKKLSILRVHIPSIFFHYLLFLGLYFPTSSQKTVSCFSPLMKSPCFVPLYTWNFLSFSN